MLSTQYLYDPISKKFRRGFLLLGLAFLVGGPNSSCSSKIQCLWHDKEIYGLFGFYQGFPRGLY